MQNQKSLCGYENCLFCPRLEAVALGVATQTSSKSVKFRRCDLHRCLRRDRSTFAVLKVKLKINSLAAVRTAEINSTVAHVMDASEKEREFIKVHFLFAINHNHLACATNLSLCHCAKSLCCCFFSVVLRKADCWVILAHFCNPKSERAMETMELY